MRLADRIRAFLRPYACPSCRRLEAENLTLLCQRLYLESQLDERPHALSP